MPRITTLFFDLGNTLIYSQVVWEQVMPQAVGILFDQLPRLNGDVPKAHFEREFLAYLYAAMEQREKDLVERPARELLAGFLQESSYPVPQDAQLQAGLDAMYSFTQQYWHLEADAHPTLQQLRRQGFRLAVISNAMDDRNTQALIDKADLRAYFEVILSSASAGIRKPHATIFKRVLHQMGVRAQETAMVGDTLNADILGAQSVGLYDIWIQRRADTPGNRVNAQKVRPTATIQTLEALPELIQSLSVN